MKILQKETGNVAKLYIDKRSVKIEKFSVEHQLFTQLSDHYGVTARIILVKESEIEEKAALEDQDKNDTINTSLLRENSSIMILK